MSMRNTINAHLLHVLRISTPGELVLEKFLDFCSKFLSAQVFCHQTAFGIYYIHRRNC